MRNSCVKDEHETETFLSACGSDSGFHDIISMCESPALFQNLSSSMKFLRSNKIDFFAMCYEHDFCWNCVHPCLD